MTSPASTPLPSRKSPPTEKNELLATEGQWVKYDQGSDHMPLVELLQGHGTGWCEREWTAQTQLKAGDFYVYYSKDKEGNSTIPRAAIRMVGGRTLSFEVLLPTRIPIPTSPQWCRRRCANFPMEHYTRRRHST